MMQRDNWQRLAIRETVAKAVTGSIVFSFFLILLEESSGRSNAFIISKRQYLLRNKFYDRSQTLQAEAISNIFAIDWPTS